MKDRIVPAAVLLMFAGGDAACGGSSSPSAPIATVTVTGSVSGTATGLTSSPSSSETAAQTSDSPQPTAGTTGPPILTGITTTPKKLVLAEVFASVGWEEGPVSVPKHSGTIQGTFSRMGCGVQQNLELRFADQSGILKIDLAQALDSQTSGATLEFKLLADGRLVDTTLVKFNGQGHLETDLTGVSAVRMEARHTPGAGTYQATAVITDMTVIPRVS